MLRTSLNFIGAFIFKRLEAIKRDKSCDKMSPVFTAEEFREYPNTQVRKLKPNEIEKYMSER